MWFFPPQCWFGLQSFQCSKIRSAQHWGRRAAHLSENKGVKRKCKKFGENSRQMAPVSAICDEYWRLTVQLSDNFAARLTSFFTYHKMLPRSTIVGYDELCLGFFFPFPSPLNNTMNAVPLCKLTVRNNKQSTFYVLHWLFLKYSLFDDSASINFLAGCSWTFYARHFAWN